MTDVRVPAERLPGIGWRYTLPADTGRHIMVVVERSRSAHVIHVDPRLDEPLTTGRLSAEHAALLAALLTGARLTIEAPEATPTAEQLSPGEVVVETVRIPDGSPAIGLAPQQVTGRFGSDACLLGVICDATPQLVETDEQHGVQVGDKLVVAARRSQLEHLRNAV